MGSRKNGLPPVSYQFKENVLFAGQEIDSNQYIHSKFMAERHIYEEIMERMDEYMDEFERHGTDNVTVDMED